MNNIIAQKPSDLEIKINPESAAKDILNLMAAYTPQFYKFSSLSEKQKEVNKIALAIDGIQIEVLKRMCELCIRQYKFAISRNIATRINLDYFLSFYITAYNQIFVKKPDPPYRLISSELTNGEFIKTEYALLNADGSIKETMISCRIPDENELERLTITQAFSFERKYTSEQMQAMSDDISEINL